MEKEYNTIVLSGGAMRGFGIVGALQFIQDQNKLQDVKKYIGTSIGAILAYLICIGYTPTELMVLFCQKQVSEQLSAHFDILNIVNGTGAMPFHILQDFLEKLTIKKIKRYITLSDLYQRFGKELVCATYNMTMHRPEYVSYHTHPDMNCITALRMTSNLPFLFETFIYDDYKYIDGGLCDNFPISQVSEDDIVVAVRVKRSPSAEENEQEQNLISQLLSIIYIPMHRIEDMVVEKAKSNKNIDVISIDIPAYMSFQFNASVTSKFDMFSLGYDTIKKYFKLS